MRVRRRRDVLPGQLDVIQDDVVVVADVPDPPLGPSGVAPVDPLHLDVRVAQEGHPDVSGALVGTGGLGEVPAHRAVLFACSCHGSFLLLAISDRAGIGQFMRSSCGRRLRTSEIDRNTAFIPS